MLDVVIFKRMTSTSQVPWLVVERKVKKKNLHPKLESKHKNDNRKRVLETMLKTENVQSQLYFCLVAFYL